MFPNPQDALQLPPRPNLEQYRKLAKDLVKACPSGSIAAWADRWMALLLGDMDQRHIDRAAQQVEEFARRTLTGEERHCVLADAQFVLARSHGFLSWAAFAAHLDALAHGNTEVGAFESAADAIVRGDEQTLQQLLMVGDRLDDARFRIGRRERMRQLRHRHRRERDEAAQRQLSTDALPDLGGD